MSKKNIIVVGRHEEDQDPQGWHGGGRQAHSLRRGWGERGKGRACLASFGGGVRGGRC